MLTAAATTALGLAPAAVDLLGQGLAFASGAKARRAIKKEYEDVVEKGGGGLSLAERQQIAADSARAAAVQQQIAGAENRALAAMNPSAAGQAMQAQSQGARDAAATAAQGMAGANELSLQLREARRQNAQQNYFNMVDQRAGQIAGMAGAAVKGASVGLPLATEVESIITKRKAGDAELNTETASVSHAERMAARQKSADAAAEERRKAAAERRAAYTASLGSL